LSLFGIADRVAGILDIDKDEVYSKGRQSIRVKARSLLCYWASRELGIPHNELAKRLELSKGNISASVERGEMIAKHGNYSLE
jgi:putative transposase